MVGTATLVRLPRLRSLMAGGKFRAPAKIRVHYGLLWYARGVIVNDK